MAYCEPVDLYAFGVPRGALPSVGRLVAGGADISADAFDLDSHGLASNDPVTLRAEAGGSLPAPLVAGTTYYAIPVSSGRFQLSATEGGSAIGLTTTGDRVVVVASPPLESACDWASRVIDDMLPAHVVPLATPYPEIVRMTAAELAAGKVLSLLGLQSEALRESLTEARRRLERWARGVPVRTAGQRANLAASASAPARDPRGWRTYGGL